MLERTVMFINGTVSKVSSTCGEWCLEQHYVFDHNEVIRAFWILAIALIILIVYWGFRNCPAETYREFRITTGLSEEQLEKILYSLIPLSMLLIVMYIVYVLIRFK